MLITRFINIKFLFPHIFKPKVVLWFDTEYRPKGSKLLTLITDWSLMSKYLTWPGSWQSHDTTPSALIVNFPSFSCVPSLRNMETLVLISCKYVRIVYLMSWSLYGLIFRYVSINITFASSIIFIAIDCRAISDIESKWLTVIWINSNGALQVTNWYLVTITIRSKSWSHN